MKIIIARHGESARNRGFQVASEENNLTAEGVKQAIKLGADIAHLRIDAIYCSNSPRCVQTMDEILRIREDNMPIHLTSLVGPKIKTENFEKLKARVELFLDDLKYDHKEGETVLIVTHLMTAEMMSFVLTGNKRRLENGEFIEITVKDCPDKSGLRF